MCLLGMPAKNSMDSIDSPSNDRRHAPGCRVYLADVLWPLPLRWIVQSPRSTAKWFLTTNLVYVAFGELLGGLIWVLTWPGFALFTLVGVYLAVKNLARAAVYPAFVPNVRRSLERDIAKEIRRRYVTHFGPFLATFQFVASLHLRDPTDTGASGHIVATICGLDKSRDAALSSVFVPLANALKAQERQTHESKQMLQAIEKMNELEGMFRTLVLSPALQAQGSEGNGFQTMLAPSLECIGIDELQRLCQTKSFDDVFIETSEALDDLKKFESHPWLILREYLATCKVAMNLSLFLEEPKEAKLKLDEGDIEMGELLQSNSENKMEDSEGDDEIADISRDRSIFTGGRISKLIAEFKAARKPLNALASIDLIRSDLQLKTNGVQAWIACDDGVKLDSMFIPARTARFSSDKRTVLVCNPNCGMYEYSLLQCQWVKFYTNLGFNVMLFNYRGYGRSEGWPSPDRLCKDGENILEYLVKIHNVQRGWIGIHAESIGGVVSCHLAKKAEDLGISFFVADRTFCNLPATASKMIGAWAGKAIRTIGWQANNTAGFLLAPKSLYRVCTCDPNDEIIHNNASLKSGAARALVDVMCKDFNSFPSLSDSEKQELRNLAKEKLGDDSDVSILENFRDDEVLAGFALASIKIVEGHQAMMRDPLNISTPSLVAPLQMLIKVLWFVDGGCGECLGSPLSFVYHRIKEEKDQGEADGLEKKARDWVGPLRDWIANLLVWGLDTPPISALIARSDYEGAHRSPYNLCGMRGLCGPLDPVPLPRCVTITHNFAQTMQGELETAGLYESMLLVSSTLVQLDKHLSVISSTTVSTGATQSSKSHQMHLIPINSGHNGKIQDEPLEILLKHLRAANWLPDDFVPLKAHKTASAA